jgi:hypothetical protein
MTGSELCLLHTLHNEQDFSSYLVRNGIMEKLLNASLLLIMTPDYIKTPLAFAKGRFG